MPKYGQQLPIEIESKLDAYIERIKAIQWFKPAPDLDKSAAENQIRLALTTFGVTAEIEWRQLKDEKDWDVARDAAWDVARDAAWDAACGAACGAARNAAWGAARNAARNAAWDAACGAAWDVARDAAWDAARDAAWDAAWSAEEILVADISVFGEKYPKGAFLQLIPLWEMGLYPIGVIGKKFVIYLPEAKK